MLQSFGKDIALERVPSTGKFDFKMSRGGANNGNPQLDSSATHAVMTTVMSWKRGSLPGSSQQQGGYYWDASSRRGTLLWTVKYDRLATRSDLLSALQDGGQQLVDLNWIASFTAEATRSSAVSAARSWKAAITWTLPGSQNNQPGPQSLEFTT